MKPSVIRKRSITISGRKTSVSMEDDFWLLAKEIAKREKCNVQDLIERENQLRDHGNLSLCIRLLVLRDLKKRFLTAEAELGSLNAAQRRTN